MHDNALEELEDAPVAYRVVGDVLESLENRVLVSDAPEFETRCLTQLMKADAQATVPNVDNYHRVSVLCQLFGLGARHAV